MDEVTRAHLKQLTNVELSVNPEHIHVLNKSIEHQVRARGEVGGCFNAKQFPNIWAVEVAFYNLGLLVAQFAFA